MANATTPFACSSASSAAGVRRVRSGPSRRVEPARSDPVRQVGSRGPATSAAVRAGYRRRRSRRVAGHRPRRRWHRQEMVPTGCITDRARSRIDLDLTVNHVDDPVHREARVSIDLGAQLAVVHQAGVGDLDDQDDVVGAGMLPQDSGRPRTTQRSGSFMVTCPGRPTAWPDGIPAGQDAGQLLAAQMIGDGVWGSGSFVTRKPLTRWKRFRPLKTPRRPSPRSPPASSGRAATGSRPVPPATSSASVTQPWSWRFSYSDLGLRLQANASRGRSHKKGSGGNSTPGS